MKKMKSLKKFSAFAPTLSAVLVVSCIGVSLKGYTAPVYTVEIPETVEKKDAKETDKELEETEAQESTQEGSFDLADGVYEGTGMGYAGTITVSVEIKDKKIVAIDVLSVEADDEAFFNRAKAVIDRIIDAQSLDVDVVSGATYSSNGIIDAVKNALTGEVSETNPVAENTGAGSTTIGQVEDASEYKDGVYYGTGTGFGGPLTVKVTVSGGKIASIEITETSDGSSFVQKASSIISKIIATQSTNVDTVSGATYSSVGIIEAVRNALSQAGGSSSNTATTPGGTSGNGTSSGGTSGGAGSTTIGQVQDPSAYKDGIYYGTGTGFGGALTVKVGVNAGKIASIEITETSDGSSFIQRASSIISQIIATQSTNVDTVSGATYSSVGIIEAVRNALSQAAISNDGTNGQQPSNPQQPSQPEDSTQPSITGTIPYKDGVYSGTGEGYLGDITVSVTIQNRTITNISIVSSEDDAAFFNRAKAVVDSVIKKQSVEVDTVSGATYSSKGILEAIENALKEADKATNGQTPSEEESSSDEGNSESSSGDESSESSSDKEENESSPDDENNTTVYVDGDYTATVVCTPDEDEEFEAYHLSLKITVKNDKIVAVTNIVGDGEESNNSYINRAANGTSKLPGIVNQILENGTLDGIDAVSRATCSSKSMIEACNQALESARRVTSTEESKE